MTKAVLFDFDETLQDRTEAFEKYMDLFLTNFAQFATKEREKERGYAHYRQWRLC